MSNDYGFLEEEGKLTHYFAEKNLENQIAFISEVAHSFIRLIINGKVYTISTDWREDEF